MSNAEIQMNRFLVDIFNDVLHLEEMSLSQGPCKDLSISEMHVIEAVANSGDSPSMSSLAARLRVTASTLTIAVKTLEQKGYLQRHRCEEDKRRVSVHLTDKAAPALAHHAGFHQKLIEKVSSRLSEGQLEDLAAALACLHDFFSSL